MKNLPALLYAVIVALAMSATSNATQGLLLSFFALALVWLLYRAFRLSRAH